MENDKNAPLAETNFESSAIHGPPLIYVKPRCPWEPPDHFMNNPGNFNGVNYCQKLGDIRDDAIVFIKNEKPLKMVLFEKAKLLIMDPNENSVPAITNKLGVEPPFDAIKTSSTVADILPFSSVNAYELGKEFKPGEKLFDVKFANEQHPLDYPLTEPWLDYDDFPYDAAIANIVVTFGKPIFPNASTCVSTYAQVAMNSSFKPKIIFGGEDPNSEDASEMDGNDFPCAHISMISSFTHDANQRIEYFDGNPTMSLDKWMLRIKLCLQAEARPPTEPQKVAQLVMHLKGSALRAYYVMSSPDNQSFDAIETHLKAKFPSIEVSRHAARELSRCIQMPSESVHDFTSRLAEIVHTICEGKSAEVLDEYLFRETMTRLLPQIRLDVQYHEPANYDELLKLAKRREQYLQDERDLNHATQDLATTLNVTVKNKRGQLCYNCRQRGHIAKECRNRRRSPKSKHRHSSPDRNQHLRENFPNYQQS